MVAIDWVVVEALAVGAVLNLKECGAVFFVIFDVSWRLG